MTHQNFPILGNVMGELNLITGNEDAEINQLSEVILKDPNLTSLVLKVANSVQYNLSHSHINTVSRAIVHIGLKGVRAICISSLVLDTLVHGKPKDRVLKLVAQGIHAATQARNLFQAMGEEDGGEEVFIAALLFNLGEMGFWASDDNPEKHQDLLNDSPEIRREAMAKILGTSFKAITLELARQWHLGEVLEQALYPRDNASLKVKAVVTGERLSRAACYGWQSPQLKKVLKEVADYTGMSMSAALKKIKEGGDEAAEVALSYGVAEACPLIPSSLEDFVLEKPSSANKILKSDSHLQLSILRDLSIATQENVSVNTIFQMVLEGMHRGIGLERVCLAFIKGRKLEGKHMLGEGVESWHSNFVMDISPFSENIFTRCIELGGSCWFKPDSSSKDNDLYSNDVVKVLHHFPCFIHVIEVDNRKVAVFYADRSDFGGKLSHEQFESFKHFCSQAQISLNLLSKNKSQGR